MWTVFATLVTFKLYLGMNAHGSDGNGGCKLNPTYTLCLKLLLVQTSGMTDFDQKHANGKMCPGKADQWYKEFQLYTSR